MTEEEYKAAIEKYKAEHAAGGSLEHGEWKKHKYIRIENGRYIYPEDVKPGTSGSQRVQNINNQAHFNSVSAAAGSKERVNSGNANKVASNLASAAEKTKVPNRASSVETPKKDVDNILTGKSKVPVADLKTSEKLADYQKKHDIKYQDSDEQAGKLGSKIRSDIDNKISSLGKRFEDKTYSAVKNLKTAEDIEKFFSDGDEETSKLLDEFDALVDIATYDSDGSYNGAAADEVQRAAMQAIMEGVIKSVTRLKKEGYKIPDEDALVDDIKDYVRKEFAAPMNDGKKVDKRAFKHSDENSQKKIQHSYTDPKAFYAAVYDYKQAHKR